MASTPILPFANWAAGTTQNSVPANDNSRRNQILNGNVISQAVTAQPASPSEGDIYIIAATHTGTQWSTFTPKDLAIYSGGTWYAFAPVAGVVVNVAGTQYQYASGAWSAVAGGTHIVADSLTINGDVDVPHGVTLTKQGVLITRGGSGSWKESRVESPYVFWDPKIGKYRMVYLGYNGTPTSPVSASIGYATSPDLQTWTEYASNPVFSKSAVGGSPDENGTSAPMVWYENGTYYLFYLGLTLTGLEQGVKTICLATSTDFVTWTRLGAVITTQASTWRSAAVWHPNIVKRGTTYFMFFNAGDGASAGAHESIGFATSTNLTSWTVDDANSPVLDKGVSGWDSVRVGDPFVYRIRDTWYMVYYGSNGTLTQDGMAFTSDALFPLGWTKFAGNPVLTVGAGGSFDAADAGRAAIWITPTKHYHWYTTSDGATPPLVQIATAVDLSLSPSVVRVFTGCRAYNNGYQSIPNATSTALTFDSEEFDTDAIHSTSSNTSRFVVPAGKSGKWRFSYHLSLAVNATGTRIAFIRKNGGTDSNNLLGSAAATPGNASLGVIVTNSTVADVVAGDYVEVYVYQTSGGALNVGNPIATDRGFTNTFEAEFLG